MHILFDFLYLIFMAAQIPVLFLKRKWHSDYWLRFGGMTRDSDSWSTASPVIWVHAVSVGEVIAVAPLIRLLNERHPHFHIVCSTVTCTGQEVARRELAEMARIIYAPFDLSCVVRRYIQRLRPALYIAMETEIWPNLYRALQAAEVPLVMVNGRISDRSWPGYRRLRWLLQATLSTVDLFCMQSESDARRIIELGADPTRVRVMGNLKFDRATKAGSVAPEVLTWREGHPVLLAGSTHPGEESLILDVYLNLKKDFPQLLLILVPRHVERTAEVAALIGDKAISCVRLSALASLSGGTVDVLLVDQIGRLSGLYPTADLVFIGKTLCGTGGQNMIEPVSCGIATIVGPHTENFKEAMDVFRRYGVIFEAVDAAQVLAMARSLLGDKARRDGIRREGPAVVRRLQGATEATLAAMEPYFPGSGV